MKNYIFETLSEGAIMKFNKILKNCSDDISFLNDRQIKEDKNKPLQQRSPMNLIEKLNFVVKMQFFGAISFCI